MHPIKRWLDKHQLTQRQLCELLALRGCPTNQGHISAITKGSRYPSRELARAIALATFEEVKAGDVLLWQPGVEVDSAADGS